jgi:hypothetical protein
VEDTEDDRGCQALFFEDARNFFALRLHAYERARRGASRRPRASDPARYK